jgi:ATP-dependent DNA helicase RecQ
MPAAYLPHPMSEHAFATLARVTAATTLEELERDALACLRAGLGPEAGFRDDQLAAIRALVAERARVLVVQRTGWGKSVVYFVATALLRAQGAGPALIVSPLLSLMRDQERAAARFGLATGRLDHTTDRAALIDELRAGRVDVLFTTPEQLARDDFPREVLPALGGAPALLVIDEAHCVSDWGHDFRPEYRLLARSIDALGGSSPVLATTATANGRVTADVAEQIGAAAHVLRGPLTRESLRLQAIRIETQAERLAWLAEHVPGLPGSGVVYTLTIADADRVAAWLQARGVDAAAYHSQLGEEARTALESRLLRNELKALVATVALGMGFDKPDLGFVVHFQEPASIVAYYQQVGRAGRALPEAHAILLSGAEDARIHEHFITTAVPGEDELRAILDVLEEAGEALPVGRIAAGADCSTTVARDLLGRLRLDGAVAREGSSWRRTDERWSYDRAHVEAVRARKRAERAEMHALPGRETCLMQAVVRALDDVDAPPCGTCAVCAGPAFPERADPALVREALGFLRRADLPLAPRQRWAATAGSPASAIPQALRADPGRALSIWGDGGWGDAVRDARITGDPYGPELVDALADLVGRWRPRPAPAWVAAVPGSGSNERVEPLAEALADRLRLPFHDVLARRAGAPRQRALAGPGARMLNARAAYELRGTVPSGPALLVDDVVESRWTLTACAALLRGAGSGPVLPLVLAQASRRDEAGGA